MVDNLKKQQDIGSKEFLDNPKTTEVSEFMILEEADTSGTYNYSKC